MNLTNPPTSRPALIYVGSPFTPGFHTATRNARKLRLDRYDANLTYAAKLAAQGTLVFAPVIYGYHLAAETGLSDDSTYWLQLAERFLPLASELHVLMLSGWKESRGLTYEITRAVALGINIQYIDP